jgi:two-component system cell cycle sensor histidine kinase/response regulator CckA
MEAMTNNAVETEAAAQNPLAGNDLPMVLAIDDNDDFRAMIVELLDPAGFKVLTAANPVKGLELFIQNKDKVKLVILDYYMPQLDGAKTFEWLRKLSPDVKVIICSGAEELRLRQIQAEHKIDGYLHKPFRVQEALQLISRLTQMPSLAVA